MNVCSLVQAVLGGNAEIASKFSAPGAFGDKALVQQFLAAAPNSTSPIQYRLQTIWDFMADRTDHTDHDTDLQLIFNELLKRDFFLSTDLPHGSYPGSCSDIAFDHMTGILTASCGSTGAQLKTNKKKPLKAHNKRQSKGLLGHARSSLGYYLCSPKTEVTNIDGILKCSGYDSKPSLPGGDWLKTCSPVTWSNGVLTAWCYKDNDVKKSVYDMKNCPNNQLYLRYTGYLECEGL